MLRKGTVASFPQPIQSDGSSQNRALGNCPASHACPTPCVCLTNGYAQADKVLPFPFGLFPVDFIKEYNDIRPHEALDMETPAKGHKYSDRHFGYSGDTDPPFRAY